MKENENLKNLLEAIKQRKPLIMDLGDDILLYMKWDVERNVYVDEMGMTSMDLIQQIIRGEIDIDGKKVEIRIDENGDNERKI